MMGSERESGRKVERLWAMRRTIDLLYAVAAGPTGKKLNLTLCALYAGRVRRSGRTAEKDFARSPPSHVACYRSSGKSNRNDHGVYYVECSKAGRFLNKEREHVNVIFLCRPWRVHHAERDRFLFLRTDGRTDGRTDAWQAALDRLPTYVYYYNSRSIR